MVIIRFIIFLFLLWLFWQVTFNLYRNHLFAYLTHGFVLLPTYMRKKQFMTVLKIIMCFKFYVALIFLNVQLLLLKQSLVYRMMKKIMIRFKFSIIYLKNGCFRNTSFFLDRSSYSWSHNTQESTVFFF